MKIERVNEEWEPGMKILRDFSELRKVYNVKDAKILRATIRYEKKETVWKVFKNLEFPKEPCVRSTKL